jgi:transcriptional regulator with XRE-family HTH domain
MRLLRIDWFQLLDSLKERMSLTETALAASVGLSRSMLSQCRGGGRPLPLHAKFRLLDKLGYTLTRDLMLAALSDESRDAVLEADNGRAMRRAERAVLKNFLESQLDSLSPEARDAWFGGLRKLFRDGTQFGAAESLEEALELSETEMYSVERGHMRLPFWSRSALLEHGEQSKLIALIDSIQLGPQGAEGRGAEFG